MAEAVGTTLGALGLAGLLSVCLDCFSFIQDGRSVGKDFTLLHGELINQQFRFRVWTQESGFLSKGGYDRRLDNPGVKAQIRSQLNSIALLFMDAKRVGKKYQIAPGTNRVAAPGVHIGFIEENLHEFLRRIKQTKRQAGFLGAFCWALKHRRCFETMLQSLEKCINALYFATEHINLFGRASLRNVTKMRLRASMIWDLYAAFLRLRHRTIYQRCDKSANHQHPGWYAGQCNGSGLQDFVTVPEEHFA